MSENEQVAVAAARMRRLVDAREARPLMVDHWPVPVRWRGRWWHLPVAAPVGDTASPEDHGDCAVTDLHVAGGDRGDEDGRERGEFVVAPVTIAEGYERLHRRYVAASAAVAHAPHGPGDSR